MKVSFENILISLTRKPKLIETDDGGEFVNKILSDFSHKNNFKPYKRYTSLGAVLAERFDTTIRDLPKRPVFEKGDSSWVFLFPIKRKQYNNRTDFSTKPTPTEGSLKKNEGYVYQIIIEKPKKKSKN